MAISWHDPNGNSIFILKKTKSIAGIWNMCIILALSENQTQGSRQDASKATKPADLSWIPSTKQ